MSLYLDLVQIYESGDCAKNGHQVFQNEAIIKKTDSHHRVCVLHFALETTY